MPHGSGRPSYVLMVKDAVLESGKKGATLPALKKHLEEKFDVDPKAGSSKAAIKRAIADCIEGEEIYWVGAQVNTKLKLSSDAKKAIEAENLQPFESSPPPAKKKKKVVPVKKKAVAAKKKVIKKKEASSRDSSPEDIVVESKKIPVVQVPPATKKTSKK